MAKSRTNIAIDPLHAAILSVPPKDEIEERVFQHKPLGGSLDETRVITIHPDLSESGLIQCDIEHTTTTSEYTCLSYEWGSPQDPQTILLNGRKFLVRENLFRFLEVARESHHGMRLWVDAICIDQLNIDERNQQVGIMSRIYSQAIEVIAWLGSGEKPLGRAFEFINLCDDWPAFKKAYPADQEDFETALDKVLCADDELAIAINEVCRLSYWGRLWIIQELVLAREVRLWYGSASCGAYPLTEVLILYPESNSNHFKYTPAAEVLRILSLIRRRSDFWHEDDPYRTRTLSDMIVQFQWYECSDWMDHIYGLVGLAEGNATFTIDYNRSKKEFLEYTLWYCTQEQNCKENQVTDTHTYPIQWRAILKALGKVAFSITELIGYDLPLFRLSFGGWADEELELSEDYFMVNRLKHSPDGLFTTESLRLIYKRALQIIAKPKYY